MSTTMEVDFILSLRDFAAYFTTKFPHGDFTHVNPKTFSNTKPALSQPSPMRPRELEPRDAATQATCALFRNHLYRENIDTI